MTNYRITRQRPTVYLGVDDQPIQGFLVSGVLTDFNEHFEIRVPTLDALVVAEESQKIANQRQALDRLNNPNFSED